MDEDHPEGQEGSWAFVMCSPRFVQAVVEYEESKSGVPVDIVRLGRFQRIVELKFFKGG